MWDWVEQDLIDLGIKSMDPTIFAAADFKHVSTSQLQHSLLKVALLLGVRVRYGCSVDSLRSLRHFLSDEHHEASPPHLSPKRSMASFQRQVGESGGGVGRVRSGKGEK